MRYLPWNRPSEWVDRICMRDSNGELTYADVSRRVEAIAEQFTAMGVRAGDVVAVMLPNRVELLLALMAAWRNGAAATPINPMFTANEAGYQIHDSGAVLLVAPTRPNGVPYVRPEELATEPNGSLPAPTTGLDDLAMLIYTSGSTGRPKGVRLDHANLTAMAGSIAEAMRIGADDHCLVVLPLFHVNAICVSCLAPLQAGGQVTILARFSPDTFLGAIESTGRPTSPPCPRSTPVSRNSPRTSGRTPRRCVLRCAARRGCRRNCCSAASHGSASR